MKRTRLMEIIREVIEEEMMAKLKEVEPGQRRAALGWGAGKAKQQADAMGLEYYGFGRYGKNGKVTHKSEKGKLVSVSQPSPEPEYDAYDAAEADDMHGRNADDFPDTPFNPDFEDPLAGIPSLGSKGK